MTGPEHIAGALLLGAMVGGGAMAWLAKGWRDSAVADALSGVTDRRLAIRKAKRAARSEASRKGWQTRRGKRDA